MTWVGLPKPGAPLSDREVEIVRLIAKGLTSPQIGAQVALSPNTVKTHTQRIAAKLGVTGRGAIVAAAYEQGVLRLPDRVLLAQAARIEQARRRAVGRAA